MAKKKILTITDDPKLAAAASEALSTKYLCLSLPAAEINSDILAARSPDLIIIDFELQASDGLQLFKHLGPAAAVIMLSSSGSIPLAVCAAKLGVAEFLRKPIVPEELLAAVDRNILRPGQGLFWLEEMTWLSGDSPSLKKMFEEVQLAILENKDIVLVAEPGVRAEVVAEFIHKNSPRRARKFTRLNVAAFQKESLETHFWTTLQELLALPSTTALYKEGQRPGTVYLDNFGRLDENFKLSVLNFFSLRPGRLDRSIRLILEISTASLIKEDQARKFNFVHLPSVRQRRGDLPYLLRAYLKHYSDKYNKAVKFVATDVLDFLASYDFPGNYVELEKMIEAAVLAAPADKLELKNFPFVVSGLIEGAIKKSLREGQGLEKSTCAFEKNLYHVLLAKANGDVSKVASWLDIHRSTLADRLASLL